MQEGFSNWLFFTENHSNYFQLDLNYNIRSVQLSIRLYICLTFLVKLLKHIFMLHAVVTHHLEYFLRFKHFDQPHQLPAQPKTGPKHKNDQKWVLIIVCSWVIHCWKANEKVSKGQKKIKFYPAHTLPAPIKISSEP